MELVLPDPADHLAIFGLLVIAEGDPRPTRWLELKVAWYREALDAPTLIAVKSGHAKNAPSHRHRSWPACLYGESQGNNSSRPRNATDDRNQKQRRNPCLEGVEWTFRLRDTDRIIQCAAFGRQSFLRRIRSIADALFNLHPIFFYEGLAIYGTYQGGLGRPVSHGCVRLAVSHARMLYSWVKQYGASIEINGMASEILDRYR